MKNLISRKIDIIVHGRFHGFSLAHALLSLGHDVVVHTNYPASVVERWHVPRAHVRSFLPHGIASRLGSKIKSVRAQALLEPALHNAFARWAARGVRIDADIIYGFSGVMEQFLRRPRPQKRQLRILLRGSSHIREQSDLLQAEERRVGLTLDRPSQWMIEREEREYGLADSIFVLSNFARDSFIKHKIQPNRIMVNPLGVNITQFQADVDTLAARRKRILSGDPLRVLTVGTFSYRKGARDLVDIARNLNHLMSFQFVGDFPSETSKLRQHAAPWIELNDRVAEATLPSYYRETDLFLFPTLEDGFAAVLAQAVAGGLPILATTNCSAPDMIAAGSSGWAVPIRSVDAFAERLRWCHDNRSEFAALIGEKRNNPGIRTWIEMATEVIAYHDRWLQNDA